MKLVKKYMKQVEKVKMTKKNSKVTLDAIKKRKKDVSIYLTNIKKDIESGSKTFAEMHKEVKKLLNASRKIEKDSKSHLSILPVMQLGQIQQTVYKDHENATIAFALKNGDDLVAMKNGLTEAKKVSKNVTQFGLANNVKKSGLRLVASLKQPNLVVPEKYITKVVKELGGMLGAKKIKNMGRAMYFEVPKWDELEPKLVAKEIARFLETEELLTESILKRDRNKFLKENKQNKFLAKGSLFLKESLDKNAIKAIEASIESAYDKDGRKLDSHDFDYQVQKDGSFYVEFDYARSRMKGYYVVSKNYRSLEYSFVDEDGLDYDESYKVKGFDDALKFIMNQG